MIRLSIYLFLLVSIFFACQNTKENTQKSILPAIKKEYHFDLKADASRYKANVYYDKGRKEELIYFYDHNTDKSIKVFDLKGNLIKEISLKKALSADKAITVKIMALDTILISTYITNKLLFINKKGEVWKKNDLNSQLLDSLGNQYELWKFETYDNKSDNLLFVNFWSYNIHDRKNGKEPKNFYQKRQYYCKNKNMASLYCNVSNIYNDKPEVKHELYAFYTNFINPEDDSVELPSFSIIDNNFFLLSVFTDTLYVMNLQNFEYLKKKRVKSSYTPIGQVKPLKNDSASIEKNTKEETHNVNLTSAGYMTNILYDSKTKQYALIITHQKPYDKSYKNLGYDNFSVMFMNQDFEKIKEVPFNITQKNYSMEPLESSEGLLFRKRTPPFSPKDKTNAHEKVTLTIFDFDK